MYALPVLARESSTDRRLHQLVGRPVGDELRLITIENLRSVAESPAALLLELPQREIGGLLPGWDELVEQAEWARERGAAVHMDGARLWGCEAFYGRTLAEIAGLFDTVYVSLYKQLGGITGCCLAGPEDWLQRLATASRPDAPERRSPPAPRRTQSALSSR